jgi:hypothetical protein
MHDQDSEKYWTQNGNFGIPQSSHCYPLPYHFGSFDYQLVFFNPSISDYRTFRRWWGYPSQILIVPAFAFDVVFFPIEVVVLAYGGYITAHTASNSQQAKTSPDGP